MEFAFLVRILYITTRPQQLESLCGGGGKKAPVYIVHFTQIGSGPKPAGGTHSINVWHARGKKKKAALGNAARKASMSPGHYGTGNQRSGLSTAPSSGIHQRPSCCSKVVRVVPSTACSGTSGPKKGCVKIILRHGTRWRGYHVPIRHRVALSGPASAKILTARENRPILDARAISTRNPAEDAPGRKRIR